MPENGNDRRSLTMRICAAIALAALVCIPYVAGIDHAQTQVQQPAQAVSAAISAGVGVI